MKTIKYYFLALFLMTNLYTSAQEDKIILRNGQEMDVKITQIDIDKIYFKTSSKKDAIQDVLNINDIYMLYTKTRGQIYISPEGKRFTGSNNQDFDKNASIIYLTRGGCIPASDININGDEINYKKANNQNKIFKKKAKLTPFITINASDVFMIRYSDGTRDIITRLESNEDVEKTEEKVNKSHEMQVIFHNVNTKETLATISKRYGVKVEDIIKWNDLPIKTRANAALQKDMQLIIYVEPVK